MQPSFPFTNLVFEGGGVWGIAYLGMLEELDKRGILNQVQRVGGSSAGAITAMVTSFGLSAAEMKKIADSLDYQQIPGVGKVKFWERIAALPLNILLKPFGKHISADEINCLIRMLTKHGWYSSDYFYQWLQATIAAQFNDKKKPPYTFADFQDASLHKSGKKFHDLYVTGADISTHTERLFSFQNTPDVEVATAVRISMSIPLFFEAVKFKYPGDPDASTFSDGGTMFNYPITLFDSSQRGGHDQTNYDTLGGHFFSPSAIPPHPLNSLTDYIKNLLPSVMAGQTTVYLNTPEDVKRTIDIDTKGLSATDFDVKTGDATYTALYQSGLASAKKYLDNWKPVQP